MERSFLLKHFGYFVNSFTKKKKKKTITKTKTEKNLFSTHCITLFLQDEFDYEIKSSPMMVPMADVLNHVAKNNAKLRFGKENLKMVACQSIKKVH